MSLVTTTVCNTNTHQSHYTIATNMVKSEPMYNEFAAIHTSYLS